MKIKHISLTLIAIITSATSINSYAEVSANVAATSNYLWRGLEQTNGAAAISGGIDYSHDSGYYAGAWVSNADWAESMSYELDLYTGFTGSITDVLSYDVGFIYYAYPDEKTGDADFSEIYGSLTFDTLTLGLAVLTSATGADAGDAIYANADYTVTLSNKADITIHLGSYSGDWLAEDSIDYGLSLSKDGFTFGVSNTDIKNDDAKVYVSYSVDISL